MRERQIFVVIANSSRCSSDVAVVSSSSSNILIIMVIIACAHVKGHSQCSTVWLCLYTFSSICNWFFFFLSLFFFFFLSFFLFFCKVFTDCYVFRSLSMLQCMILFSTLLAVVSAPLESIFFAVFTDCVTFFGHAECFNVWFCLYPFMFTYSFSTKTISVISATETTFVLQSVHRLC